jgi:adenylate kinase family enzyme
MKKISLLFLDHQISNSKTQKVISEMFNLFSFDFKVQFRELIFEEDNELSKEIKSLLDSGNMVSTNYLEKVLKIQLSRIENQDILLTNFPRTKEQFLMLENLFLNLEIKIERIWYIKQNNPDLYFKKYFENPENKLWIDKFDDEIIDKWRYEFSKRKDFIMEIQGITYNIEWKIIEMDYVSELNEQHIIEKINGCA